MIRNIKLLIVILPLICVSCDTSKTKIKFHESHETSRLNAPFSDAVETKDFLFLAGQIGKDHNKGSLVKGGITAETKQAIENIKAVLQHHNLTLHNVVKCTVILNNIEDFKAFNAVYTQYFVNKPARTTFAAQHLAANASIEIDVIAEK